VFASIYHPVGIAMLVSGERNVGKALGVNGVWGNAGVAFSALSAGALAQWLGWRAAFIVPGIFALGVAATFARLRLPEVAAPASRGPAPAVSRDVIGRVFMVLVIATVCGGVIFNATTISMPKLFDERLTALTRSTLGIGVLVCIVYLIAALAQLIVGTLIDRYGTKGVLTAVAAMQVPLLWLAGTTDNWLMLAVAVAMMFFVFGQIPINDAMVARYTAEEWRARAYALRYVVSFGASAAAVPLVAFMHESRGGFQSLYPVLAVLAACTFASALFFPTRSREAAAA
jgi:MFS family permease